MIRHGHPGLRNNRSKGPDTRFATIDGVAPPGFYDRPRLYDALHAEGTEDACRWLEELHARHGNGGKDWLEPACGTGRFLEALARRGWRAAGYDRSAPMLAFARRRLRGLDARALRGDLESFRRPAAFDLAFCLDNSLRHLLTEAGARAHLRATAASLKPGGIYVVGLDLADYGAAEADEEAWTARAGRTAVRQVQLALPPDRRRRRERILQFVAAGRRLETFEYELRSYDAREWRSLLARSPFRVAAAYDAWRRPLRRAARGMAAFVLKVR